MRMIVNIRARTMEARVERDTSDGIIVALTPLTIVEQYADFDSFRDFPRISVTVRRKVKTVIPFGQYEMTSDGVVTITPSNKRKWAFYDKPKTITEGSWDETFYDGFEIPRIVALYNHKGRSGIGVVEGEPQIDRNLGVYVMLRPLFGSSYLKLYASTIPTIISIPHKTLSEWRIKIQRDALEYQRELKRDLDAIRRFREMLSGRMS